MELTFNQKGDATIVFAIIFAIVSWTAIFLQVKNTKPKDLTYNLISCSGVFKCETEGTFNTKEACEEMKLQLASISNMKSYICEKSE